jgi:hypothetical protein
MAKKPKRKSTGSSEQLRREHAEGMHLDVFSLGLIPVLGCPLCKRQPWQGARR